MCVIVICSINSILSKKLSLAQQNLVYNKDRKSQKTMKNYKEFKSLIPIATALVMSAAILASNLLFGGDVWLRLRPATCLSSLEGCFCEHIGDGLLKQPINAISSLAFVLVGFLMISRRRPELNLLALAAIITGLGSAFYHASLSFAGQFFDVLGMHMVAIFMIVYAFRFNKRLGFSKTLWIFTVATVLLGVILWTAPESRRYLFAGLIIIGILLELLLAVRKKSLNCKYLISGILVMAIGQLIWQLDNSGVVCYPDSLFQGHGLWHILGAIALYLLYKHYSQNGSDY